MCCDEVIYAVWRIPVFLKVCVFTIVFGLGDDFVVLCAVFCTGETVGPTFRYRVVAVGFGCLRGLFSCVW